MSVIPATVRRQVHDRDGGICRRCGELGSNIQHRIGRGAGGSGLPVINDVAALVTMCGLGNMSGCHGWAESQRTQAYRTGWAIRRSNPKHPADIPLVDLLGRLFYLTRFGGVDYKSPPGFFPGDPALHDPPF